VDPAHPDLELVVFGIPATAGNKSCFPFVKGWRGPKKPMLGVKVVEGGGKTASARKVKQWREAVASAVLGLEDPGPPLDAPLLAIVDLYLPPLKTPRLWPTAPPDLSKLIRALEDPVVKPVKGYPGLIADDSRIVVLLGAKHYAAAGAGRDGPRAELRIWQLPARLELPLERARQAFLEVLAAATAEAEQPSLLRS
jgi:Holliday junction resolvase RusA-like endonuclease